MAQNWQAAEAIQKKIVCLENEADALEARDPLALSKKFVYAVSRSDLLELLTVQDRLANKAKDIAGVVLGRRMIFPEAIAALLVDFLKRSIQASAQAIWQHMSWMNYLKRF